MIKSLFTFLLYIFGSLCTHNIYSQVSAYIPGFRPNVGSGLSVVNTSTNTAGSLIPLGLGTTMSGVSVSPDGLRAYVLDESSSSIFVINTVSNTLITTIQVSSPWISLPERLVISPNGLKLYVSTQAEIFVIDTMTNTISAPISLTVFSPKIAVSPDGSKLYITYSQGFGGGGISIMDTTTNVITQMISFPATYPLQIGINGIAVSPDGSKLYVTRISSIAITPTHLEEVIIIDINTNSVIATVTVGGYGASNIAVTPDNSTLYVVNSGSNPSIPGSVSVIRIFSGSTISPTVITTINVGGSPAGLSITPDGSQVYVTGTSSGVSVISTNTNTEIATINIISNAVGNMMATFYCSNVTITPTNSTLPSGTANSIYSTNISSTGFVSAFTWSVSSGSLPLGLFLNSSTGAISGIPTNAGTSNFTIQVTNGTCTKTKNYSITIAPACGSLCLRTSCPYCRPVGSSCSTSLSMAEVGIPYNDFTNPNVSAQYFTQTGLSGTVTWSISPALPAGLTLNSATGIITGTLISAITGKAVRYTITATNGICSISGFYSFDTMFALKDGSFSKSLDTGKKLLSDQVIISPNPSTGDFRINFGTLNVSKSVVYVYNAQGTTVYTGEASNNMSISLETLSSGIYFLEVKTQEGSFLKKLLKE